MIIPEAELRKVRYHYRRHPDFGRGWRNGMTKARTERMGRARLRRELWTLAQKARTTMAHPMSNLAEGNLIYMVGMAEAFEEVLAEMES